MQYGEHDSMGRKEHLPIEDEPDQDQHGAAGTFEQNKLEGRQEAKTISRNLGCCEDLGVLLHREQKQDVRGGGQDTAEWQH